MQKIYQEVEDMMKAAKEVFDTEFEKLRTGIESNQALKGLVLRHKKILSLFMHSLCFRLLTIVFFLIDAENPPDSRRDESAGESKQQGRKKESRQNESTAGSQTAKGNLGTGRKACQRV